MFGFGRTTQMVTADEAMPGRPERPYEVSETHRVLGTPQSAEVPEGHREIFFAMGCFWGSERIFWQVPGVWTTAAGYIGGYTPHPTYEETCSSRTGHTESVRVVYDPAKVDIEALLKAFWENHDPTQVNGQGNDIGTQYRSAIYTTTDDQLMAAEESRERYQKALAEAGFGEIATEIAPASSLATPFYYAEDYHQQYLDKNPSGYCNHGYCQAPYNMAGDRQQVTKVELPGS